MSKFDRPNANPAHKHSQHARSPVPSLAHNVHVERVHVRFFIPSTDFVSRVHQMLLLFLSDITSPHIEQISIEFFLSYDPGTAPSPRNPHEWPVGNVSADAIAAFHACLTRDVFAGLGQERVSIRCSFWGGRGGFSFVVRQPLARLFAPWLVRGVVRISLPNGSKVHAMPEVPPQSM